MELQKKLKFLNQDNIGGHYNIDVIIHNKKKIHRQKKKRKRKLLGHGGEETMEPLQMVTLKKEYKHISSHSSMPNLKKKNYLKKVKFINSSSLSDMSKQSKIYRIKLLESNIHLKQQSKVYGKRQPVKLCVYRCQFGAQEESCCCSCNSDAMFEVMKSLYDCYKKKNCDNCNCILCGHLPLQERRQGEIRKSIADITDTASARVKKEKIKKAVKSLEGKSPQEKEQILKELALTGTSLPEGRTASEKELIKKVMTKLGLPPQPTTAAEKEKMAQAEAAGLLVPLEGKTAAEKEKILMAQAKLGIPLPEGRTASEKALTDKVKTAVSVVPSEKIKKAKAAGLITPLTGKTHEEKEKILRGLIMSGIPLPEGKTASEKKLIEQIITEGGKLPPTKIPPEKLQKAKDAGLLTPLEGKTPKQKEKILRGLVKQQIPLPEAKTVSEKKLIDKIRQEMGLPPEPKTPSTRERYVRAQAQGLITPLEGKNAAQKEKILRAQAAAGLALPEGRTRSDKALIEKIKKEVVRLPSAKVPTEKLEKVKETGLLTPLQGKTPEQKEKILRAKVAAGLPLPEGKTTSEKALIEKIKKEVKKLPFARVPSDKLQKAKEAGLLTPLQGKTPEQKEKILRGLVKQGIPLPEAKTASDKKFIDKIRNEMRLPPEPKTPSTKERYARAQAQGLITPLEGKSTAQKEKILRAQATAGLPLPEGKTASENAIIEKVRAEIGAKPSARQKPTSLSAVAKKLDEQTAKVMKEGKGPSDECICGILTPESEKFSAKMAKIPSEKLRKSKEAGLLTPLEGKTPEQKEKILRAQAAAGLPLLEGKTASEKAVIEKIKKEVQKLPSAKVPSEKLRKAKEAGLLTPLQGKTPEQKEKILRGLVKQSIPLPEAKTASDKRLIDKIRNEMRLPPEPKTSSTKKRYARAQAQGLITPLEGKSAAQKEKILRAQAAAGISLPEVKTASEKALIEKIKKEVKKLPSARVPSEKLQKAKEAGLLTPLQGKTPEQKEKILRGLVKQGIPLPEAKTASDKKLIDKIRNEMRLPPEPKTSSTKKRYARAQAQGLITPLEGKSAAQKEKILRAQAAAGISLPEVKTASEKALIEKIKKEVKKLPSARVPSEKLQKAKEAGLLTPLQGKTPEQKEKILRGLVKQGIPLPEAKTASDKKLIDKIRNEMRLPPEPKTSSTKERDARAQAQGLITPLEGKSTAQKEKILRAQATAGLPLPEGKTASENAIIEKIRAEIGAKPSARQKPTSLSAVAKKLDEQTAKVMKEGKGPSDECICGILTPESEKFSAKMAKTPLEKLRKAKEAGLLTPLEGKTPEQKEKILRAQAAAGLPLHEGKTASEKAVIEKIKKDVKKLSSARIPSEKLRKAKEAGLLTPLEGKTPEQKDKIFRGLVKQGIPLPEAKTASDKRLLEKVRRDMGLPPEPTTASMRGKYAKAAGNGIIVPLEGKSPAEKVKILNAMQAAGIPLPDGRSASEKVLIRKVQESGLAADGVSSAKMKAAKEAGLLTPLVGKSSDQKEKILRGLVKQRIPLPLAKTASEKKLIDKIRQEMGLPPEPKTSSTKERYARAQAQGLITPLEGKSAAQKEKILRAQAAAGISLPEVKTASEKALIEKIKKEVKKLPSARVPSEKLQKAKEAGLLTPLQGKTPEQKEKILRGLVKQGIPLPEAKTASDKKLIDKIRNEMRLPPEPKTSSTKKRYARAQAQGLITPLEGKSAAQKEKILRAQAAAGISLPEVKTASEKALIEKIKKEVKKLPSARVPSEKLQKAKEAGLLTPLQGKTPEQKEKILRGLVKQGIPLPEAKTASDKKLIDKIRNEMRLPPEPKTSSTKERYARAQAQGLITPLEGKSTAQKEKILRAQATAGLPLPEGKTASENAIIEKIRAEIGAKPSARQKPTSLSAVAKKLDEQTAKVMKEGKGPSDECICGILTPESEKFSAKMAKTPLEKLRKAKEAGLLTPLEGKTPEQKEKILRAQAAASLPLHEGKTASEKAVIEKIKKDVKKLSSARIPSEKLRKAKEAGLLTPLEGKTPEQKDKIFRGLVKQGIPLPEAKTASDKKLIDKIRNEMRLPPEPKTSSTKKRYARAQAQGLITPLEGKSAAQKEKILRAQAAAGISLPEVKTASEKALIEKIKKEVQKLPSVKVPSEKLRKAKEAGLLTPLEGKSPEQKEKILKGLAERGIPLPEAKTASEKKIMEKIKTELRIAPSKRKSLAPLSDEVKKFDEQTAKVIKEGKGPVDECVCGILTPESENISVKAGKPPSRAKLQKATSEQKDKIKAEARMAPLAIPIPSEKLRKAKAAGLLTPLEGKSAAQKEKILKGLAEAGIPLPEGKTATEKALVKKVKTEYGIPPEAQTAAEKEIVRKAKAEGLLTPLKGKTRAEKERIVKGLAEAGLPIPEGKTASEKALIRSIRTAAGLPAEPTPSERARKIKKITRKVGEGAVSKKTIAKAVGVISKAGIVEEFQDVLKTTTCERGCGCDKKKIRFKHSYVKIRITSPDISSLCPCPDECVPGVKGGVFVDNEGIKVTVGSAIGFPSFTNISSLHTMTLKKGKSSKSSEDSLYGTDDDYINIKLKKQMPKHYMKAQEVETIKKHQDYREKYMIDKLQNYDKHDKDNKESNNLVFTKFSRDNITSSLVSMNETIYSVDSDSNLGSLLSSMTESSLSFSSCSSSSSSTSIATISVISLNSESISPTSSHYICIEESFASTSNIGNKNDNDKYDSNETKPRKLKAITDNSSTALEPIYRRPHKLHEDDNVVIFNLSQLNLRYKEENRRESSYCKHNKPIIIIKNVSDTQDVLKMVKGILSKENIEQTSSVIIVAPTSTDEDKYDDTLSDTASSTICIRMSKNYFNWSKNVIQGNVHCSKPSSPKPYKNEDQCPGIKFTSIGRHHLIDSAIPKNRNQDQSFNGIETLFEKKKNQGMELETLYPPPSLREPMLPPLHSLPHPPPPVQVPPEPYPTDLVWTRHRIDHAVVVHRHQSRKTRIS